MPDGSLQHRDRHESLSKEAGPLAKCPSKPCSVCLGNTRRRQGPDREEYRQTRVPPALGKGPLHSSRPRSYPKAADGLPGIVHSHPSRERCLRLQGGGHDDPTSATPPARSLLKAPALAALASENRRGRCPALPRRHGSGSSLLEPHLEPNFARATMALTTSPYCAL